MTHLLYHTTISDERDAVLRYCTQFIGASDIAEDVAQQTMLAAWRHEDQLRDPQARRAWLLTIARRQCLMWARTQRRDNARLTSLDDQPAIEEHVADAFDLEHEVERGDLARLLDRAMAMLPAEARRVLVLRYIEELPQAEIALRMGVSEGAIEARLHRGKLAFREVLTNSLSDDAVELGLITPDAAGWQSTRLWCPSCGHRRLDAWFKPWEGQFYLRCAACSERDADCIHAEHGTGFRGIRTHKPAINRVLDTIHALFRVQADGVHAPCPACGEMLPISTGAPDWTLPFEATNDMRYVWHPGCGGYDRESWHSLTWSLPEVRTFWKQHPRMRFIPARPLEVDGSPAVVTGFESMTDDARIDVVTLSESLRVVSIDGRAPGRYRHD